MRDQATGSEMDKVGMLRNEGIAQLQGFPDALKKIGCKTIGQ